MKLKNYCIAVISWLVLICATSSQVEAKTFTCDGIRYENEMNLPAIHKDLLWTWKVLNALSSSMDFYQAYLTFNMNFWEDFQMQDASIAEDWKYFADLKTNKVYYCMNQYLLTGADAKTFEILSSYIAKDKNRIYFLQYSRENYWDAATYYTIVSNDKKINTSLLQEINLSNSDFDRWNYYSYAGGVFMVNGFNVGTGDDIMEYRIIPLWIRKNQLTWGRQQYQIGWIFVWKNPLIYWAILSWAKLPLDMSPIMWPYLTVVDANGKIWKYKDKFGKLVSWPRYLEFNRLVNSQFLWSWFISQDSKIIDDYIVYSDWLYYADRDAWMIITNIDKDSFKSLGDYYQDKNNTYAKPCIRSGGGCELQIINFSGSLVSIGWWFARDNVNIYQWTNIWTWDWLRDAKSFEGKKWQYDNILMWYGDKNRFYCTRWEYWFPTIMLTGTSIQDIKLIDNQYWTDGKNVYARECSLWTGVDGSTFKSITLSGQSVWLYADKLWLYFGPFVINSIITGIDIGSVNVLGYIINNSLAIEDKNWLYILNWWGGYYSGDQLINYPWATKLPFDNKTYKISKDKYSQWSIIVEDDKYVCDGRSSWNSQPRQFRCTVKTKIKK